ncbi:MAG: bifunctional precorrin-2 dehydrogenase/sirohydrochlorin ferrochelatase [Thermodesulfovibrionales bacterium]|nr:bifunctional precorrin-2 dehydrogenase/sirohydrochlorin ferrochelatase [Thermodesulfovibrionales bacterium]
MGAPLSYYPAFIVLKGKNCIVVGGGRVAERKVADLLKAQAEVTVISPALTPTLTRLAKNGRISHKTRGFRESDLNKAFLAIAATDHEETNLRVAAVADGKNMLVNIVDHPELCTFIVPSSFSRGPLQVAISTSGASPALARAIRRDMQERYGSVFGRYLTKVRALRKMAVKKITSAAEREKFFRSIAAPEAIKKLLKGSEPKLPELPVPPKKSKRKKK